MNSYQALLLVREGALVFLERLVFSILKIATAELWIGVIQCFQQTLMALLYSKELRAPCLKWGWELFSEAHVEVNPSGSYYCVPWTCAESLGRRKLCVQPWEETLFPSLMKATKEVVLRCI